MKLLTLGAFASFVLLSALAAEAMAVTSGPCPDLSGSFVCTTKSAQPAPMTISQRVVNGVTIYTLTNAHGSTQLPADNIDLPLDDKGNRISGVARFNCEDGAFKMLNRGQQRDSSNTVLASWDLTQSLILNENKDLVQTTTGTTSSAGKVSPVNDISTCLRKPTE